ncbi:hypothetical protein [Alkalihalobacillus sp. BA299]|uniref:hypothetical protein n=1 Tax=Alkalihalobacillus sp. BA299 TaxID=2815938 RepID=UPI001ADB4D07|nr:hypothetical protein [Alkalihalobacillus sp. BA299]
MGKFTEDKFNKRLEDESNFFSKVKKELGEKYITIPITENMLLKAVNKKKMNGISDLSVRLIEDKIVISGAARKLRITINFRLELKPLVARNRELSLKVVGLKPIHQHWITNKILNKPPFLLYQKGIIHIDLSQIEQAKSIRIGNLKYFEVKDEKLWIGVGI